MNVEWTTEDEASYQHWWKWTKPWYSAPWEWTATDRIIKWNMTYRSYAIPWWPNVPLAVAFHFRLILALLLCLLVGWGLTLALSDSPVGRHLGGGLTALSMSNLREAVEVRDESHDGSVVPSRDNTGLSVRVIEGSAVARTTPRFLVVRRGNPVTFITPEPVTESIAQVIVTQTSWSCAEIERAAVARGFSSEGARTVAAIAMAESGGRSAATAITPRERSYGVLQVNVLAHPNYSEESLRSLGGAIEAAWRISGGGKNFHPWTSWTSGKSEGMCL